MGIYRIREDGALLELSGLRSRFPNVGFSAAPTPEFLDYLGVDQVALTTPPETEVGQQAEQLPPAQQEDGSWVIEWQVVAIPAEELSSMLQLQRDSQWAQIKGYRDTLESTSGVFVSGHWFHSDDKSLIKYLGLKDRARDILTAGGSMADPITENDQQILWSALDNQMVPMTVQLSFDLVEAVAALQAKLFKRGLEHKYGLSQSADPKNYDYSTGWPDRFVPQ